MALTSGTRLGPYELAASIGAGGMGEVYRAHDARLGRDVAVKIISASFAQDAGRVHRFEQEARAAAALSHPNILAVYDIGTLEGSPYIVSELLEGSTLRDRLREGPLPMRKVVDYALQIARGLAAAHDRGIVHRDLKPDNVFITNDGRAKILDFGLAKLTRQETGVEDLTRTIQSEPGMILGTVGYMSPEQVRGKDADPRSDLFSFGAVLYEMVSGLRAFKGDSSADILSAILKEEPPDLVEINASVSPALDRIVRHCLEKNPAERFQSAHDLAFDLETLSSISRSSKELPLPPPKTRVWLWPAVIALLLVATGVAFLAGHARRATVTPEFHQLTYRSGTIYGARFTNDGNSILYSAAWEASPIELYTSRSDSVEARSLAPKTLVAAISSKNQLAVLLEPQVISAGSVPIAEGTLALLPLEGGAPRPVLQHVNYADWTPDGSQLAVIRTAEDTTLSRNILQFPVDTTIYTPPRGWISHVRFSPDGKYLAFQEHVPAGDDGKLIVVDRSGKKIAESPHYDSINSLAWASNEEVWFTGSPGADSRSLRAMNLRGQVRDIYRAPEDLTIYDVAADGRLLLTGDSSRLLLIGGQAGSPDKDLTWLGWSLAAAISDDGSTVLFSESGPAVGGNAAVYIRKLDSGSPAALQLGGGLPTDISPDGNWVATLDFNVPPNIVLLPTGVGKPVQLTSNGWEYNRIMHWMPDSGGLLVNAVQPGHKARVYLIDVKTKQIQPVLPEGVRGGTPSPDGKLLLGNDGNARKIYNLKGEVVTTLAQVGQGGAAPLQLTLGDVVDRWTADGKSLFVWNYAGVPRLDRLEIATGKRVPVYSVLLPNTSGIVTFTFCRTSKDGKAHVCSASRLLNDLFVVNGLR
jgi:eukaryotic-like serine/threonine-protein kinase